MRPAQPAHQRPLDDFAVPAPPQPPGRGQPSDRHCDSDPEVISQTKIIPAKLTRIRVLGRASVPSSSLAVLSTREERLPGG